MSQETKEEDLQANGVVTSLPEVPEGYQRIRVQFAIDYKGHPGSPVSSESLTEPNMHMTVAQMLQGHANGKTFTSKNPLYFETEIPTFSDITEVEEYKAHLERKLEQTNEFIRQEVAQKRAENAKTKEDNVQANDDKTE